MISVIFRLFSIDPNIVWLEFVYDLVDGGSVQKKQPDDLVNASIAAAGESASYPGTNYSISHNHRELRSLAEILNEDYQLKECYRHDGTHLHPRYVSLVEKAFQQCQLATPPPPQQKK